MDSWAWFCIGFGVGLFVLRLWDFIKNYLDDSDAKNWKGRL